MDRDELTSDGFFYCTREDIEEDTTLTSHQQRVALKALEGIVEVERRGIPSKNFYRINEDALEDFFSKQLVSLDKIKEEKTGAIQVKLVDRYI